MNRFLVLGFEYNNNTEYCLVRYKKKSESNEYAITIMNGELEKLLFGHHIITEKDGFLLVEMSGNEQPYKLKEEITNALGDLLGLPVLAAERLNKHK